MGNPFEKYSKQAPPEAAAPAAPSSGDGNPFAAFSKSATPQSTAPSPVPEQAPPSAISLSKLEEKAPELINLSKAAGIVLEKRKLTGVKAAVYLVLDYSGSMTRYYRDGTVQDFSEKILAAAAHFDEDGSVPVILFDSVARRAEEISLDNYKGAISDIASRAGRMGTTSYDAAIQRVIEHYQSSGSTEPALVIFQTDGAPNSRSAAERAICEASRLPLFWQFVGFGQDRFEFLHKLDELAVPKKRIIDNAGFFSAGSDPRSMAPEALYDALMGEFPTWLAEAKQQGIVL